MSWFAAGLLLFTGSAVAEQARGDQSAGKMKGIAVVRVAAGGFHSVLLREDGTVWAWGNNAYGHLGNAPSQVTTMWPFKHSSIPLQVVGDDRAPLTDVEQIAAGYHFTLALTIDGTVWAWGSNAFGQLGDGSTEPENTAFTRKSSTPAKVRDPGGKGYLTDIVVIAAGYQHGAALRKDGTVWAWGNNSAGQLGDGASNDTSSAVQVKGPGGEGYLTDIMAIAAGARHTVALKKDGTVWAWGSNSSGQLGHGATEGSLFPVQVKGEDGKGVLEGVQSISASVACTVALKKDGTVRAWGNNSFGQLGDGTRDNRSLPVQVKGENGKSSLSEVSAIAAGRYYTAAWMQDGTVRVWGFHEGGLRGDGTREGSSTPVPVKDPAGTGNLSGVTCIAAGSRHILALKADGMIMAWGDNHCGQLGDAAASSGLWPVPVRDVPVPPEVTHGEGRWSRWQRAISGMRVPVTGADFKWATRYYIRGGRDEANSLDFTAVSNGHLTVSFDVRVSSAQSRTLDIALLPDASEPENRRGCEAWFLVWGRTPGKFSAMSDDIAALDGAWHRYEIISNLDARTYDVLVDGKPVAEKRAFRYGTARLPAGTHIGRLRIGSTHHDRLIRGTNSVVDGAYADIANIRIGAELR